MLEITNYSPAHLAKNIKTIIRGVQKEKHQDFKFLMAFPYSILSHKVSDLPDVVNTQNRVSTVMLEITLTVPPKAGDF